MNRKKLTIGLFGFGCVGKGLFELLEKTPALNAVIKRVCIKDPTKERSAPLNLFTTNGNEILDDKEINVVVELIDDAEAAKIIVTTALNRGKAVVSANKKMIAQDFGELLLLQKKNDVPFLYEAACCASIPVIRNLEEYYDNDLLQSIEGIINGSTNYILTRTAKDKISYDDALKKAQENGFAESDPTLDVSGTDARNKLVILIAHAFGNIVDPDSILTVGIDRLRKLDHQYAAEKESSIKLVAKAWRVGEGKVGALVIPKLVNKDNWLYQVNDEFNGLITQSSFSDTQFFVGKGAGSYPTASAVISDISALSYDYRYEYKKINAVSTIPHSPDLILKVFCSYPDIFSSDVNKHFDTINETYSGNGFGYTTGIISNEKLAKLAKRKDLECSFILLEDEIKENILAEEVDEAYLQAV
jgi:homoserine dehydrogenase